MAIKQNSFFSLLRFPFDFIMYLILAVLSTPYQVSWLTLTLLKYNNNNKKFKTTHLPLTTTSKETNCDIYMYK